MAARREITITSLHEVMPEIDRMLENGYDRCGNWALGDVCNHLTQSVQNSVEGFGFKASWFLRMTLAKVAKRQIFATGKMRAGISVPQLNPKGTNLDDRAEAEALRAAIAYYLTTPSPRAEHPFFGKMTSEDWDRLHAIHSGHHLSFLIPR